MPKETVKFAIDRETKGALRFNEVDDEGQVKKTGYTIGTLYLRKDSGPGRGKPQVLSAVLEWK